MTARAMPMVHETDPKDEILEEIGAMLPHIEVLGASVLVAVYKRPERTKSGLYLADRTREEDNFQGKVGLVLRCGELAFVDDATHRFGERKPKHGDWIVFQVGDTFGIELGERRCRFVEDVHVKAIIPRPDMVW